MKSLSKKAIFVLAVTLIFTSVFILPASAIFDEESQHNHSLESYNASEYGLKSGIEMFKEYIATLDDESAQAILSDHDLVHVMQQDAFWYPEAFEPTEPSRAVSLPLSAYPAGSYFSVNGSACSCHSSCTYTALTNSCNLSGTTTPGNCKKYNGAIQCMGFAHYVYKQYNGADCSSANQLSKTFSIGDATDAKDYFLHLSVGSHIRVNSTHSIIIGAQSTTGITVYDANSDGKCGVRFTAKTWSELASAYPAITYAFTQSHSHYMSSKTPWTKVPSVNTCLQRTGACIYCGASVTEYDSYHNMVNGQCTKCGYYY